MARPIPFPPSAIWLCILIKPVEKRLGRERSRPLRPSHTTIRTVRYTAVQINHTGVSRSPHLTASCRVLSSLLGSEHPQPPLASPLLSTPSAGCSAPQPLFGRFPVLFDCLTSHVRSSLSYSLGIHSTGLVMRPNVGPPGSRAWSLCTCSGSLTTQVERAE